ncbi:hypothetical protein [Allorhizocola rhizosphaerae]|uniref:hypothetical protein n=1 Tax=Allorhizocola rhizosphaerae TaxID=1872709 RepID=UPI000E3CAC69|nr:hypothetical protein [Allorhizocola rhizosphaerae]
MEALENPILFIEEFGAAPDLTHRRRAPGAAMVYRSHDGGLSCPPGGYTAGELLWRRPREVYLVDVAPHFGELEGIVVFGHDGIEALALRFDVIWQVIDPVEAVAARLTQPPALCRQAVEAWCHRAVDPSRMTTAAQIYEAVGAMLPQRISLSGGLRLDLAGLRSVAEAGVDGSSQSEVLSTLFGRDPRDAWQEDADLAQAALLGLPAGAGWARHEVLAEEVVALTRRAVQRYADLVERIEKLLPKDGGPEL